MGISSSSPARLIRERSVLPSGSEKDAQGCRSIYAVINQERNLLWERAVQLGFFLFGLGVFLLFALFHG